MFRGGEHLGLPMNVFYLTKTMFVFWIVLFIVKISKKALFSVPFTLVDSVNGKADDYHIQKVGKNTGYPSVNTERSFVDDFFTTFSITFVRVIFTVNVIIAHF